MWYSFKKGIIAGSVGCDETTHGKLRVSTKRIKDGHQSYQKNAAIRNKAKVLKKV